MTTTPNILSTTEEFAIALADDLGPRPLVRERPWRDDSRRARMSAEERDPERLYPWAIVATTPRRNYLPAPRVSRREARSTYAPAEPALLGAIPGTNGCPDPEYARHRARCNDTRAEWARTSGLVREVANDGLPPFMETLTRAERRYARACAGMESWLDRIDQRRADLAPPAAYVYPLGFAEVVEAIVTSHAPKPAPLTRLARCPAPDARTSAPSGVDGVRCIGSSLVAVLALLALARGPLAAGAAVRSRT